MEDTPLARIDPERQESRAEAVVHKHALLAVAGGLIPVPLLDLAAVTNEHQP